MAYEYEDVLRWINSEREGHDLPALAEIPRGERHSARLCPVALALGGRDLVAVVGCADYILLRPGEEPGDAEIEIDIESGEPEWAARGSEYEIALPEWVARFIADFDAGLLPQFEVPS